MLLSLLWIAYSISSIELTLKWNHVSGVSTINSIGQLFPLTSGIGLLAYTFIVWKKEKVSTYPISENAFVLTASAEYYRIAAFASEQ